MMALVWKQLVKHRVKFKFFSRNPLDYPIIIFNSPLGYINKSLNPQIMERESVSNQMQSALELLAQNLLSLHHELQPELREGNNFPFCPGVGTVCLWFYAFESRFGGGHLVSENPFFFSFFLLDLLQKNLSSPMPQQNVKEGYEKMLVAASQEVQTLLLQLENLTHLKVKWISQWAQGHG